ncbi:DUF6249 domain-containing protein [Emticicia sp. C21]|uniref:DUF6249 domain-containing protein n=1 Tax=Emticicia sp. C21 TaxID=2302915 RepID=UPI000E34506E|nr:DUF6249 domain-containing protein [Emticicia sp. C21]RFS16615.1 hypothetical protein D0T08_07985 [Emticicia sp. C21]
MDEILRDALVSVSAFAGIFGIVYVYLTARNRERLLMIERGTDASKLFNSRGRLQLQTLKFGMLFVGIALGILIGNILHKKYDLDKGVAFFSMVFLFGGLSLIIHFLIDRKIKD